MRLIVRLVMGLCALKCALLPLFNLLFSVLAHHQSEAAHQEGTVFGERGLLEPHENHSKSHQNQSDGRGLGVAEYPIDHS